MNFIDNCNGNHMLAEPYIQEQYDAIFEEPTDDEAQAENDEIDAYLEKEWDNE